LETSIVNNVSYLSQDKHQEKVKGSKGVKEGCLASCVFTHCVCGVNILLRVYIRFLLQKGSKGRIKRKDQKDISGTEGATARIWHRQIL